MVVEDGQGQGICLFLLLQPFWRVHPSGLHSGKPTEESVTPAGVAVRAKSQVVGRGDPGCFGGAELP